jgi:tRNA(fMet)-specific endonuclease VapC
VSPQTSAVLLDTDVFSYHLNANDRRADFYRPHVQDKILSVSFITVGELYCGAAKRQWGAERVAALEARLATIVVIPYDIEVYRAYATLKGEAKTATGTDRFVGANDLWIAACAIRHELPLVSNNRKHFEGLPGLRLISQDLSSRQ